MENAIEQTCVHKFLGIVIRYKATYLHGHQREHPKIQPGQDRLCKQLHQLSS